MNKTNTALRTYSSLEILEAGYELGHEVVRYLPRKEPAQIIPKLAPLKVVKVPKKPVLKPEVTETKIISIPKKIALCFTTSDEDESFVTNKLEEKRIGTEYSIMYATSTIEFSKMIGRLKPEILIIGVGYAKNDTKSRRAIEIICSVRDGLRVSRKKCEIIYDETESNLSIRRFFQKLLCFPTIQFFWNGGDIIAEKIPGKRNFLKVR